MPSAFPKTVITITLLLIIHSLSAQNTPSKYVKQEAMIPMRDGIKLHTVIFRPKASNEDLPFLLMRSPYGVSNWPMPDNAPYIKDMADDGYIFVLQDIRGRYKSEGQYVMLRPQRNKKDPKSIDESSDTYDTIDWLLKNISG